MTEKIDRHDIVIPVKNIILISSVCGRAVIVYHDHCGHKETFNAYELFKDVLEELSD